jgi:Leucine-rich repeat (LRR) protein
MFHRYFILTLVLCVLAGCKQESITEEQKNIRAELEKLGVEVMGNELLSVNLQGSEEITSELLKKIASYGKISYINFQDSNVTDECLKSLQGAEGVETIFLNQTDVTDEGLSHLADMSDLIILHLPQSITDAGFETVGQFTALKTLVADGCQVTDKGMASLENLSELRWLKINNTKVGDKGINSIKDLTNLHTLEISNTKITDRGLLVLSGLSKLNIVEMTGCNVSAEAVAALRKELPETEIESGETLELDGSNEDF